ncbi:hypothetical protein BDV95DRAFT_607077 [Massariosphaeria phaeospora]|uniref:Uncharacterized protein n=1 Tax=Massariosphaeria phaeospora TaxID=100035 RepID=A0A7C8M8M6_9PLEO|nr:hypothetical protein BDV95DRAFT_607077 [Massariosphaeria phaeospora]
MPTSNNGARRVTSSPGSPGSMQPASENHTDTTPSPGQATNNDNAMSQNPAPVSATTTCEVDMQDKQRSETQQAHHNPAAQAALDEQSLSMSSQTFGRSPVSSSALSRESPGTVGRSEMSREAQSLGGSSPGTVGRSEVSVHASESDDEDGGDLFERSYRDGSRG